MKYFYEFSLENLIRAALYGSRVATKAFLWIGAVVFLVGTLSQSANAQAWQVNNTWTNETEDDFDIFLKEKWKPDIFVDPASFYYKLGPDCADNIILARAAFAMENGLPFRAKLGGRLIDQNYISASRGDERTRFFAFANFIMQSFTSSESQSGDIAANTFPVEIRPQYMKGGVIFSFDIVDNKSGEDGAQAKKFASDRHVYLVKEVLPQGLIHFTYSTVPPRPRRQSERIQLPMYVPIQVDGSNKLGFRRFYQPQDYLMSDAERRDAQAQRGRSDSDQTQIGAEAVRLAMEHTKGNPQKLAAISTDLNFMRRMNKSVTNNPDIAEAYQYLMQERLRQTTPESLTQLANRQFTNLCLFLQDRATFVLEGYRYYQEKNNMMTIIRRGGSITGHLNACSTEEEKYYYTTPGRDGEMIDFIIQLKAWWDGSRAAVLAEDPGQSKLLDSVFAKEMSSVEPTKIGQADALRSLDDHCKIEISPGRTISARTVVQRIFMMLNDKQKYMGHISSMPWVSLERRWGETPLEVPLMTELEPHCGSY